MTRLDRLIRAPAGRTTVVRLDRATRRIAEQIAKHLLDDETVRAEMHVLVRKYFSAERGSYRRRAKSAAQGPLRSTHPARRPKTPRRMGRRCDRRDSPRLRS